MANAIVTLKVMPDSPETDLTALQQKIMTELEKFCGETEVRVEIEPVAFGLKAIKLMFVMDESKGSPDPLAESIEQYEEVNSAEITDVRRAIG
ncbi:elongation factor 1-beta [Candidatus Woesearchaeota archaeon]|nr:elongation factor 1-beta [Candidatus Woesearchaeota archaeon]